MSRNSFQYTALVRSIVRVHSRRFVRILTKSVMVVVSSLPLVAQLSYHFLRARLTSLCCTLSSGANQHFEYGHGLASGVYLFTAIVVPSIKLFTVCSSWSADSILEAGPVVFCTIFPICSQSARSYTLRGGRSGASSGCYIVRT